MINRPQFPKPRKKPIRQPKPFPHVVILRVTLRYSFYEDSKKALAEALKNFKPDWDWLRSALWARNAPVIEVISVEPEPPQEGK